MLNNGGIYNRLCIKLFVKLTNFIVDYQDGGKRSLSKGISMIPIRATPPPLIS